MLSTEFEQSALASATARAGTQQYLTFVLGGDSYAAGINSIREILEVPSLTRVPLVPAFVRGVINLRGSVVPVIDLAARLGLTSTAIDRRTCVAVVEDRGEGGSGQTLGVVIDSVQEILEIAEHEIEPAPSLGTRIDPAFMRGVAKVNGRLQVVLDFGRVLAPEELAQLVTAHAAA
jgi:purine-binding chemotaxis protein CheW